MEQRTNLRNNSGGFRTWPCGRCVGGELGGRTGGLVDSAPGGHDHKPGPTRPLCRSGPPGSSPRHPGRRSFSFGSESAASGGKRACPSSAGPESFLAQPDHRVVRNLRQAVERELALHRRELRISLPSQTMLAAKPQGEKNTKPIRVCSQVVEHGQEGVEQWRQEKLQPFETIRQMKASGMKVSEIAGHLGINRRRIDKWVRLEEFPERSRMEPRPGMVESFREYLRERWEQGCHHGHELLAEIQQRGYIGCYTRLAQLLSPWRQAKPAWEAACP